MYTNWKDHDYDLAVIISKEILQWIEWIGCNGKVIWEVLEEDKPNMQDSNKMKKMYSYISQDTNKKSTSAKCTKGMKKALRFHL